MFDPFSQGFLRGNNDDYDDESDESLLKMNDARERTIYVIPNTFSIGKVVFLYRRIGKGVLLTMIYI